MSTQIKVLKSFLQDYSEYMIAQNIQEHYVQRHIKILKATFVPIRHNGAALLRMDTYLKNFAASANGIKHKEILDKYLEVVSRYILLNGQDDL